MKGSYDELEISLYGDSDCLFANGSLVSSSSKKKNFGESDKYFQKYLQSRETEDIFKDWLIIKPSVNR